MVSSGVRRAKLVDGVALAGVLVAAVLALAMPRGLFSGDEGIKLAQAQQLLYSGATEASLYDRGASAIVDRQANLFARMPAFAKLDRDGARSWGTYPLLYPALAVPLLAAGGPFAVFGLSLLGLAAALIATGRLARRVMRSETAAAAVVAVVATGSSLPHYAGLIYEHTCAVGPLLAALALLVPPWRSAPHADADAAPSARQLAGAGALYALATCFRTELYAFAPALGLVLLWRLGWPWRAWRGYLAFALGAAAVLAPFLLAHRAATGFWHPTLAVSQGAPPTTLAVRLLHLAPRALTGPALAALALTALSALALTMARGQRWLERAATAAVALAWGALAVAAALAVDGKGTRTLVGVTTSTPLVALALLHLPQLRERPRAAPVLAAAAVTFIATVVLLPKRASVGGLELGARYLLPILPLLVIAALEHARRSRLSVACAVALAALGLGGAAVNARAEAQTRALGAHVLDAIDQSGADAVITPVWWVGQLAVPAQARAAVFVPSGAPTDLLDRLAAVGWRRVVVLRGGLPPSRGQVHAQPLPPPPTADRRVSPRVYQLVGP